MCSSVDFLHFYSAERVTTLLVMQRNESTKWLFTRPTKRRLLNVANGVVAMFGAEPDLNYMLENEFYFISTQLYYRLSKRSVWEIFNGLSSADSVINQSILR